MLDEIAHATNKDPVALRLELLPKQPRDAAVVRLAAEKPGWNTPFRKGRGHGRGFAYHHSFNTRIAMVAEVAATPQTIRIERMVAAGDCAVAVNPDIVIAQSSTVRIRSILSMRSARTPLRSLLKQRLQAPVPEANDH